MKIGVIDSLGEFHELPFYKIQELSEVITKTAIDKSSEYKTKFEEKYDGKITRFSKEFEFCIHELGWMLYDPFCEGKDEVLFSNGERTYVASMSFVKQDGFNRRSITNQNVGYPILTDETIQYNRDLNTIDGIEDGIIDEQGYVSASFVPSLNDLAQIELMYSMMRDEEVYKDYMAHKDEYATSLEYVTSKKNVISVSRLEDGTYTLGFVSENDGKVASFIEALKASGKLAELKPIIQNGDGVIMKAA